VSIIMRYLPYVSSYLAALLPHKASAILRPVWSANARTMVSQDVKLSRINTIKQKRMLLGLFMSFMAHGVASDYNASEADAKTSAVSVSKARRRRRRMSPVPEMLPVTTTFAAANFPIATAVWLSTSPASWSFCSCRILSRVARSTTGKRLFTKRVLPYYLLHLRFFD